ncbi:pentatricopeptide repeat-containing protein At5g15300-like isoform X2 [Prosopis cineraria]|uniref:pentatricopeptide repeat-containing protein At5g15300-like isoform X2 n=1 Tax=Prosopis cineraria TaxID=364024 RepID=UPI00240FD34B|nr:pentatricopeptide repeat-containing protein At5g15300-like isoform X2 [Prosopis cineraria]
MIRPKEKRGGIDVEELEIYLLRCISSHIAFLLHRLSCMKELEQAQAIIIKAGLLAHLRFLSKIISFSALSPTGNLFHAQAVFNDTSMEDCFICNTMIRAFANSAFPVQALYIYNHMQILPVYADHFTYNFALKACSRAHKVAEQCGKFGGDTIAFKGAEVHCTALKLGFGEDLCIQNSLLSMYSQCGLLPIARLLFDEMSNRSLVSWNIMISAYNRIDDYESADYLLKSMPGKNVVSWNTLIARYIRIGNIEAAGKVFHLMPERNAVSWNSMIAGCVSIKDFAGAFTLFSEMQKAEVKPTEVTLISVLGACAETGALEIGRKIHQTLTLWEYRIEGYLGNALLDMYAKCGNLSSAWEIFYGMKIKPVSCWNAMIVGLAVHGYCEEALRLFSEMEQRLSKVSPNRVTFIGILIACSHKGLIDKAKWYFDRMINEYKILPDVKHYGCVVDLLSRWGSLDEAYQTIMIAPSDSRAFLWRMLLSACGRQGNVELAEIAFQQLAKLENLTDADYVLLSNIFAEVEKWEEVERVRNQMTGMRVFKKTGCSLVDEK